MLGCLQSRIGRKSASSGTTITIGTQLKSQCGCNCGQTIFSEPICSAQAAWVKEGVQSVLAWGPSTFSQNLWKETTKKLSATMHHPDFAHRGWVKRIPGWVWKNGLHCKSGWTAWTVWTAWTAYSSDFRTLWSLIRQVWRVSRQCLFLSTKPTHAFATCTSSGWGGLES